LPGSDLRHADIGQAHASLDLGNAQPEILDLHRQPAISLAGRGIDAIPLIGDDTGQLPQLDAPCRGCSTTGCCRRKREGKG
jgi:hypothetical protein